MDMIPQATDLYLLVGDVWIAGAQRTVTWQATIRKVVGWTPGVGDLAPVVVELDGQNHRAYVVGPEYDNDRIMYAEGTLAARLAGNSQVIE